MPKHEPFTSQRVPEWTLMYDPDTNDFNCVRCRLARFKTSWTVVADEAWFDPWPWPTAMDMKLLSEPEEDDQA